ncbi:isoprenylcysteine carboxylmethyltransferase family protein [Amycolatopsis sp. NPDC049159]|uniref:methyltransferase family protein n=1 Tax=unclassified Amycolatopsis TaxID=2618356 RepID=UPI0033DB4097
MIGLVRVNQVPRLLYFVIVGGLGAGLVLRLLSAADPRSAVAAGFVLVHLVWIVAESRITFTPNGTSPPDPTVLPYGFARTVVVVAGALGPLPWAGGPLWWALAPAALFLGGIALRLRAIGELGRFYTHRVLRHDGHEVVTTGPYRAVRHPAYTGMLAASAGYTAYLFTVPGAVALVVLAGALVWRIRVEERMLFDVPGYPAFAAGRARLVPGVW